MPFSDVLHQDRPQVMLQRLLQSGRIPHAILFAGPDGVGKEMLATRLAAVLLCRQPRDVAAAVKSDGLDRWRDACGRCPDCELMAAGNHPDFHRIYRGLARLHPDKKVQQRKAIELSIDVIRHFLIDKIGLRPSLGRAKVFVVSDTERLSTEAQNAMLKTLEEPPPSSYLILVAPSPDVLQETTRSRCRRIDFRALPTEFIRRRLTDEHGASETAAAFLAESAQGSLGRAILHARCGLFDRAMEMIQVMARSAAAPLDSSKTLQEMCKDLSAAFKAQDRSELSDTALSRAAQYAALAVLSTALRDVQRAALGRDPAALPSSSLVRDLAAGASAGAISPAIRAVGAAEYQIGRSANHQLIFDALCIRLGRALSGRPILA